MLDDLAALVQAKDIDTGVFQVARPDLMAVQDDQGALGDHPLAERGGQGGQAVGATDELGFQAVENRVHVHDFHATILRLLGYDHERLTYRYAGRDFRLTDLHGRVVKEVLA